MHIPDPPSTLSTLYAKLRKLLGRFEFQGIAIDLRNRTAELTHEEAKLKELLSTYKAEYDQFTKETRETMDQIDKELATAH